MQKNAFASRLRSALWLLAAGVGLVAAASPAAAAPWQFVSFKKIDADPNKSYPVTEANGPWMIMVTTFRGDTAEKQAHELVFELRKHYKLNAYVHGKVYDYSQTWTPNGFAQKPITEEGPQHGGVQAHYLHGEKFQEVAVLVGDYHRVDDPDARRKCWRC